MAKKKGGKGKGKNKGKAPKKVERVIEDEEEEDAEWECLECEYLNEETSALCEACEEPRPDNGKEEEEDSRYKGFACGIITEIEEIPQKDKLSKLMVDVGDKKLIQVVSNAPHLKEGLRVVVAMIGAEVGDTAVKKTSVGGVASFGMLCDCPMLGWTGGSKGHAATVPESFAPGSAPPASRPRPDRK